MSEETFQWTFIHQELKPSKVKLLTYSRERLSVLGQMDVMITLL